MSRQDEDVVRAIFGIGLLIIIAGIIFRLMLIELSRTIFWFDVVFIPISFIAIIVCIIGYLVDDWSKDEWLIVGVISIGVFLITLISIGPAYQGGYSDEAIQKKATLQGMLEDYILILSIHTGAFQLQVEGMVVDEMQKALCEAVPDTPCEQVIKSYNAYKELVGYKNSADKIASIWKS